VYCLIFDFQGSVFAVFSFPFGRQLVHNITRSNGCQQLFQKNFKSFSMFFEEQKWPQNLVAIVVFYHYKICFNSNELIKPECC